MLPEAYDQSRGGTHLRCWPRSMVDMRAAALEISTMVAPGTVTTPLGSFLISSLAVLGRPAPPPSLDIFSCGHGTDTGGDVCMGQDCCWCRGHALDEG